MNPKLFICWLPNGLIEEARTEMIAETVLGDENDRLVGRWRYGIEVVYAIAYTHEDARAKLDQYIESRQPSKQSEPLRFPEVLF